METLTESKKFINLTVEQNKEIEKLKENIKNIINNYKSIFQSVVFPKMNTTIRGDIRLDYDLGLFELNDSEDDTLLVKDNYSEKEYIFDDMVRDLVQKINSSVKSDLFSITSKVIKNVKLAVYGWYNHYYIYVTLKEKLNNEENER